MPLLTNPLPDPPRKGEGTLSQRALNRTLLARQHMIERRQASALEEIEHLVAMQAQIPNAPYVGLWSRLEGFAAGQLANLLDQRKAVRLGIMRNTIHLVSARDALMLWRLFQPLFAQQFHRSHFGRGLAGIELDSVVRAGVELMDQQPRTLAELGALLQQRWPSAPADSLAYALRYLVPIVQVPPRGIWGKRGQPTWAPAESWLGQPLQKDPPIESLVLRYLSAFGPASIADIASWSGLTGLRPIVERLRRDLRTFRDEKGRQLFDIPDGLQADPDTPAPPRFLPEYDNILLGHQDRSRVIAFEHRYVILNGTFLLDGLVAGTWRITNTRAASQLALSSFEPLAKADRHALAEEGERLLNFAAPAAARKHLDFAVNAPPSAWPAR
jgi:hypothetical protein